MYAVISLPLESRTRATFRSAEFGFFGVIVLTWRQTPRLNGFLSRTGDFDLYLTGRRGLRTSWLIVGMSDNRSIRPGGIAGGHWAWSAWRSRGVRASSNIGARPLPAHVPKQVVYRTPSGCQVEL